MSCVAQPELGPDLGQAQAACRIWGTCRRRKIAGGKRQTGPKGRQGLERKIANWDY